MQFSSFLRRSTAQMDVLYRNFSSSDFRDFIRGQEEENVKPWLICHTRELHLTSEGNYSLNYYVIRFRFKGLWFRKSLPSSTPSLAKKSVRALLYRHRLDHQFDKNSLGASNLS